jgi:3-oxoadipate enol-lactonase
MPPFAERICDDANLASRSSARRLDAVSGRADAWNAKRAFIGRAGSKADAATGKEPIRRKREDRMAFIDVNGHRCRYRLDGPEGAPVLVLSNSLGTTLEMWDAQRPAFAERFRLLRYDTRGQGESQVTPGPYSAELLGTDVLALTEALGLIQFSYCGLSMGGVIGQWLGLNAGSRLRKLILCNSGARIGNDEGWNARIAAVTKDGMAETASGAISRWFTPEFAAAEPAIVDAVRQQLLACDPLGYAANCAVVRDADFRARLGEIRHPLLLIAGSRDPVTTIADAEFIVDHVPHAQLVVLDTAHLSNIGARAAFDAAVIAFMER